MSVRIFDCAQNSPEWIAARLGTASASMFGTIMAKGKGGGESLTRRRYLHQLAGERIVGQPMESYTNGSMQRGHEMEPEAREFYAFLVDEPLTQVGFIVNDELRAGASPDSLVGERGLLELKSAAPHVLIDLLEADQFPPEHMAQCQGQLWITGREWVDLLVYSRGLPPLVKRLRPDAAYVERMAAAVAEFNAELDAVVERVRRYGGRREAA